MRLKECLPLSHSTTTPTVTTTTTTTTVATSVVSTVCDCFACVVVVVVVAVSVALPMGWSVCVVLGMITNTNSNSVATDADATDAAVDAAAAVGIVEGKRIGCSEPYRGKPIIIINNNNNSSDSDDAIRVASLPLHYAHTDAVVEADVDGIVRYCVRVDVLDAVGVYVVDPVSVFFSVNNNNSNN